MKVLTFYFFILFLNITFSSKSYELIKFENYPGMTQKYEDVFFRDYTYTLLTDAEDKYTLLSKKENESNFKVISSGKYSLKEDVTVIFHKGNLGDIMYPEDVLCFSFAQTFLISRIFVKCLFFYAFVLKVFKKVYTFPSKIFPLSFLKKGFKNVYKYVWTLETFLFYVGGALILYGAKSYKNLSPIEQQKFLMGPKIWTRNVMFVDTLVLIISGLTLVCIPIVPFILPFWLLLSRHEFFILLLFQPLFSFSIGMNLFLSNLSVNIQTKDILEEEKILTIVALGMKNLKKCTYFKFLKYVVPFFFVYWTQITICFILYLYKININEVFSTFSSLWVGIKDFWF